MRAASHCSRVATCALIVASLAGPARFAVTNVNSHSLGIVGVDAQSGRRRNQILIPKNTPLPHTVTKVVVIAKPKEYSGPCPATIEFTGTIFVSHPARVEYRWERSDGAAGQRQFVDIRSAGQGVKDTWRLGTPGRSFDGWVRLHVLAPTGITSDDAPFRVRCR